MTRKDRIIKVLNADVICMTPECKGNGDVVNTITFNAGDEDAVYEAFDGNEAADHCKVCSALGVLQDPYVPYVARGV